MPSVAVIRGDGIGPEVIAETVKILKRLSERDQLSIDVTDVDLGAERYLATGDTLADDCLAQLRATDAILLGAMGDPRVPPGVLERGIILAMRKSFRQSVNVRPVRLRAGMSSPIAGLTPDRCDFVIVRENTEGMYTSEGTLTAEGTAHAVAVHTSVTTTPATDSCVRYSFELARRRRKALTLCHKTNILVSAGIVWLEAVERVGREFPDVAVDYVHADAMTVHLLQRPERFDVIVTDNLFGDILSDLGAAMQGGLGTAASANLNLDGSAPSLFEGIHGSAPDIAGQGIANPAAAILSMGMMLDHLGFSDSARDVENAVSETLLAFSKEGQAMRTTEFGDRVLRALS